jgi:hypothetical protein
MSRDWVFDHDRYIIRKGWGLYDAQALADMIAANPGANPMSFLLDESLKLNVLDSDYTGPEIDAINIALHNNMVGRDVAEIIHRGPTDPQYKDAVAAAIATGAPSINQAIEIQNRTNAQRNTTLSANEADQSFKDIPSAFTMNMQTRQLEANPAWEIGVRERVSQLNRGKGRGKPTATSVGGNLVTHIVSGKTNQIEGWARPYEEALKGMTNAAGKSIDWSTRNDRMIRAHKDSFTPSFRDGVNFFDDSQYLHFHGEINRGSQEGKGSDESLVDYMATDNAFSTTGFSNHAIESTYGRGVREDIMDDMPVSDEQISEEELTSRAQADPVRTLADFEREKQSKMSIIHPEFRDSPTIRNITSNQKHYLFNPTTGAFGKKLLNYLTSNEMGHGMTEEEAKEVMFRASQGKGKGVDNRLIEAIEQHHTAKGIMPSHYEGDAVSTAPDIQTGDSRVGAEQVPDQVMATPVETPDPSVPAPQPAFVPPPPAPRTIASPPPPRGGLNLPGGLSPALQRYLMGSQTPSSSPPSGIKTDIPLSDRPLRGSGGDSIQEEIASIISQLEAGGRNVSKSAASDIESYLEMVQLELAKSTIEDIYDVPTFDINSPTDIAMMGAHFQRPTPDVISILFTKGDWRNIAKTMGIEHEKVQMVKVAFS